ncbi:MAG TPA: diguanylate cyclase [Gemmatimonadales bacterium]|nr:diguanylate cyclase [Gemmatimonadales bacterium]
MACADHWPAMALHSVLQPAGYQVVLVHTGAAAVMAARRLAPDVCWIWSKLPDGSPADVCRQLLDSRAVSRSTPILVMGAAPLLRAERLDALRAGAWDVVPFPFDAEELLLKLESFVLSKREFDQARDDALLDPKSGLYSRRGIERRIEELLADAVRRRAPLTCVVLAADPQLEDAGSGTSDARTPGVGDHVAGLLHSRGRLSDSIGRFGENEFAVLAPATNAEGAVKLFERLTGVVETTPLLTSVPLPRVSIHAGFEVLDQFAAPPKPADLLRHASAALEKARAARNASRIERYGNGNGARHT